MLIGQKVCVKTGSLSNVGVFTLRASLAPIIVMVGAILFAQK